MRAEERVGEGLVGFVDEGGGAFCAGLLGSRRMEIWVVTGLEGEEFATEGTEVDGEVAGGGRSVGEGIGEKVVVCAGR